MAGSHEQFQPGSPEERIAQQARVGLTNALARVPLTTADEFHVRLLSEQLVRTRLEEYRDLGIMSDQDFQDTLRHVQTRFYNVSRTIPERESDRINYDFKVPELVDNLIGPLHGYEGWIGRAHREINEHPRAASLAHTGLRSLSVLFDHDWSQTPTEEETDFLRDHVRKVGDIYFYRYGELAELAKNRDRSRIINARDVFAHGLEKEVSRPDWIPGFRELHDLMFEFREDAVLQGRYYPERGIRTA